jgi:nitrogen-specific signal transduction histidine kinase
MLDTLQSLLQGRSFGRGLGLYVAKKIIELHKGVLLVEGGEKTTAFNVRMSIDA